MLAFTGKGKQVFMTAVSVLDSGKAVEEIAAIQILLHNLFYMGAKEAISPFKTIFSDVNWLETLVCTLRHIAQPQTAMIRDERANDAKRPSHLLFIWFPDKLTFRSYFQITL